MIIIKKEDIVAVAEDEKVEVTVAETDQSETNGKMIGNIKDGHARITFIRF